MRFRSIALMMVTFAGAAGAQGAAADPSCVGPAADACQQAVDFFKYMAPQIGTAMTGGNTTLGQGGSLGGPRFGLIPRFTVGVRVNAVQGNAPDYNPSFAPLAAGNAPPPASTQLTTSNAIVPMPAVDLALGVFKGVPLPLTNVGGVDVLLSAAYIPNYNGDQFSIKPDNNLAFGAGLRVGLLQESLLVPGVGFSFISRKLPVTTLTATQSGTTSSATATVKDLDLKSNAWRLTVSKSLLLFGLAAGVGQDKYNASTSISATVTPTVGGPVTVNSPSLKSNVTRTNYFADLSMNLLVLKLVGTVGMVSGGDIPTYNSYDNAPDKSRLYGSVGVRFGL
ncbi:MAG TPA: hypothetical protein VJ867_02375 [Gemmatimonadaceae bacterium]|nr:hypothetical protein [Gemmatimonadaceae bacterium]